MSQSLYGENGYYTTPHRVGTKGDFYTSVSASKFFGGAIASYILSLLEKGSLYLPLHIIEIGADKGYLLGDIALFLDALSQNVMQQCSFITIEPLDNLAQTQSTHFALLAKQTPLHFATYKDLNSAPQPKPQTSLFIISNELFDSFPCEVIHNNTMLHITQDSHIWRGIWQDINAHTRSIIQTYKYPANYSGIMPLWEDFISSLGQFSKAYQQCYFMSFDYGGYDQTHSLAFNPRFYLQHHVQTLMDFLAQNGDFHTLYKKADITYDVNFTYLDTLLCSAGFENVFRTSQARALIEKMNILTLLESFATYQGFKAYFREIQKVKTLLHTMGERFVGICYTFKV